MTIKTIADLNNTIRNNLAKIPHNIDFIIGIPRSGMLPATIIAEYLNAPLIDLNSFISGSKPTGGLRLGFRRYKGLEGKRRALVIDDTTFNGRAMNEARVLLRGRTDIDFIYLAVYKEGRYNGADIYLEDISNSKTQVVYEWNIFHHYPQIVGKCIYDMDGVFLPDPPDERDEETYLNYIATAPPLFTPSNEVGAICSFRLEKNRGITENWLRENGIQYKQLVLFPSNTYEGRQGHSPSLFKAEYYMKQPWAELFIESDDDQAREIARLTHKQVYCVKTNKLYE